MYYQRTCEIPPETHNLVYLLTKLRIKPKKKMAKSIAILNQANIATQYPESLEVLQKTIQKLLPQT